MVDLPGADPRPGLLKSKEPATRWIALTSLLDRPDEDPDVRDSARPAAVFRRFDDPSEDVASVDVLRLISSKGGSGTVTPRT